MTAGRYGQDFGVITEDCYPYMGKTTACHPKKQGMRVFVSEYGYVGGFYGGCNEALMRAALLKYGPLSVGIEVGEDFIHYKGGIYHKTGEILHCCLSRFQKNLYVQSTSQSTGSCIFAPILL